VGGRREGDRDYGILSVVSVVLAGMVPVSVVSMVFEFGVREYGVFGLC